MRQIYRHSQTAGMCSGQRLSVSPRRAAASIREHFPVQLHKMWASIHVGQARRFIWANPQCTALKMQSQSYHIVFSAAHPSPCSQGQPSPRDKAYRLLGGSLAARGATQCIMHQSHCGKGPDALSFNFCSVSYCLCWEHIALVTTQGLLCLVWPRSRAVAGPLHAPFQSPCVNLAPLNWSTRVSVVPGGFLWAGKVGVGCNKGCSSAEDSGKVSEWREAPCLPVLALWAVGCQNGTLQIPAGTYGVSSFTGRQRRNKEKKMNFCSATRIMGFVFCWFSPYVWRAIKDLASDRICQIWMFHELHLIKI